MIKKEFFIDCENERLHCVSWCPEEGPRAVLQIVHGMVEYIDRYDELARYLCSYGIAVAGHDHPGHGYTAKNADELGYIKYPGGSSLLCDCAVAVTRHIRETFAGVPNFILGHSMGSFVVRRFITEHSDMVSGAVIVGTGTPPLAILRMGRFLAGAIARLRGDHHPSKLLTDISFAGYNSRFSREEGEHAWISSDRDIVNKYDKDPFCTYTFRAGGFIALYETLICLAKKTGMDNIRKDLPVFITAGTDDPVGEYGKGPEALAKSLKELEITDVILKLYEGRHEILNETNRESVHSDLCEWIGARIK